MNKLLNEAIIYQIYPISFFDSNGDGKGDFNGIREKLLYLKNLGVNVLWLNPIFLSPFRDGGYDPIDFREINPDFGTKEDLEKLLTTAHCYDMHVIVDFPICHTSIEAEWFKRSQKAERNEYSDYYIWSNSWFESGKGMLKGISDRNGCVMSSYYSHQIALNYGYEEPTESWQLHYRDERLTPLRNEIIDIMQKWLNFGFDGFRIDLAPNVIKNRKTDEPLIWFWNEVISKVKKVKPYAIFLAEWGDPRLSVGHCAFDVDYLTHERVEYNDLLRNETGSNIMPDLEKGNSYFRADGKGEIDRFLSLTEKLAAGTMGKGYYSLPTGYHDIPRFSIGRDQDDMKVFFAFLYTYKTVPQVYYGDEIGLAHNFKVSKDGGYNRTGARTPMQWTSGKNRGFSTSDSPYLPTDDAVGVDVESQLKDEKSLLCTVQRLSVLRKSNPALFYQSDLTIVEKGYPLIFERSKDGVTIVVMINPSMQTYRREIHAKEILEQNNCVVNGHMVELGAKSFFIYKTGNKR